MGDYIPGYQCLPNYERPAFSPVPPKPQRGQRVLDKEKADAEALKKELEVKKAVKRRDVVCQWPEPHKCRGGLECAHIIDASLGGRMHEENLILLCAWIHRRGPESIHGKQLKIEAETSWGARGPLGFWKKGEDGAYYLVARQRADGTVERD